ncbi:MAG: nuclear transport factor 2 family protein [Chloroflexota bacterium]
MTPQATVRTFMDALQAGDFKTARSLLSGDFHFSGAVPEPLGAGPFIGLCANLKTAFPNLDYHFGIKRVVGNVVQISARLTGTHTRPLNLTTMGIGLMPATGQPFSMADEAGEVTIRDDKIAMWKVQTCDGAGLMTLLAQLTGEESASQRYGGGRRPPVFSVSRWDDALKASLVKPPPSWAIHRG